MAGALDQRVTKFSGRQRHTGCCGHVMDRKLPSSENRKLMFPRMAAKLLNAWPTHLDIRINTSTVNKCIIGESIGSGGIDPKNGQVARSSGCIIARAAQRCAFRFPIIRFMVSSGSRPLPARAGSTSSARLATAAIVAAADRCERRRQKLDAPAGRRRRRRVRGRRAGISSVSKRPDVTAV